MNESCQIDVIRLDKKGNESQTTGKLSYQLDKHQKYWWIDKYSLAHNSTYSRDSYWSHKDQGQVSAKGKDKILFNKGQLGQGAYRMTITDMQSGHKCRIHFSVYDGSLRIPGPQPHILNIETDKESYTLEEQINLRLPGIKDAKALVSIEKGNQILEQVWYDLKEAKSSLMLTPGKLWSPNVYIHVTIIQKYGQEENDLPLRMYGVKNITVDGSHTRLDPMVTLPDKLRSEQTYEFQVSEKSGKSMNYTIALVDEGLLNLTGFKTPSPFNHFNDRFPLLVKTWDIYQSLMAYFRGDYAGILSIGGDDAYNPDQIPEINRFEPVVIHQGPFSIGPNREQTHQITIPNYIGKVRLMVVACSGRNFGSLGKIITIANPLMIQSQFPRALNVSDKLKLPITLFRDDDKINTVVLKSQAQPDLVSGFNSSTSVNFNGQDQITHLYDVEVLNNTGVLDVEITASGNEESMFENTEIVVNYPNSYESHSTSIIINPKDSLILTPDIQGYPVTYTHTINVSGVPAPAFAKYADDLIRYPYGCLEQTTSSGFAQIYLDKILALSPSAERSRLENIQTVVNKLARFQRANGKYSYWRGGTVHAWSNNYIGNFLFEAQKLNYLPDNSPMLKKWIKACKKDANQWSLNKADNQYYYESSSFNQAYRLYVLAKTGNSLKSAMNRFTSTNRSKNPMVWWLIAGAYKLSGYEKKALSFIAQAEKFNISKHHYGHSFGDSARDMAIIVEILSEFDELQLKRLRYYEQMVETLNNMRWASTQTKAYSFIAAYNHYGENLDLNKEINYRISQGGLKDNYQTPANYVQSYSASNQLGESSTIKNLGESNIYVQNVEKYIDDNLFKSAKNQEIVLSSYYYNMTQGKTNIDQVVLGDDISITVDIRNPSALNIDNLALNIKMPSGWELINPRLYKSEKSSGNFEYQDFKDDRVYTFFNIGPGKKETFEFRAKAAFSGEFYHPAITCEHMYKGNISAQTEAKYVEVK